MDEETTQHTTDADRRSFEERVFARFDALDASLRDFTSRFQRFESLGYEEKLAWEQFLKEAVEMRKEAVGMRRGLSERMDRIESIGAKPLG